ncbi:MAG: hypothetical protein US63_C0015G0006 [Candidatus Moranbacteria bacterium GW2011_GWC2_37_8]|nr:MAG: hypothetical protein US63_C0015G0006 [Candidatus Moranbacteria bacterium GW2011_GWC2_37_8]KKQ62344.1 MAG: hypothetical protein US82_C0013G0014 [Parcubacteria group bacterium GW2011_GWC1_38_22]
MPEFEEGKLGLRATAMNNRRRFFDKIDKKEEHDDDEKDVFRIENNGKKSKVKRSDVENSTESKLEQEVELKKKAKKILNDALAVELKKRVEELAVPNIKNKTLLNSELFYIASVVGKNIIEDDFILVDIMETLRKGEDVVLDDAYVRKIEAKIGELSVEDLNKLMFQAFVFRQVDAEIDALKRAIEKGSIYQNNIKEIDPNTKFVLTDSILEDLRKISSAENDFLNRRHDKLDSRLQQDLQDEISVLVHNSVMEKLIIDEVSIPLNISNSQAGEEKIIIDDTEMPEKKDTATPVSVAQEEVIKSAEPSKESAIDFDTILAECREKGELLTDVILEIEAHAVTDEDKMDAITLRESLFNPIVKEFQELSKRIEDPNEDKKKLYLLLEKNRQEIKNLLDDAKELVLKERAHIILPSSPQSNAPEEVIQDVELEQELKNEKENFKTALEMASEFRNGLAEKLKGNANWGKRRSEYQESFIEGEVVAFLDELIEQEKIVADIRKEAFIADILKEIPISEPVKIEKHN